MTDTASAAALMTAVTGVLLENIFTMIISIAIIVVTLVANWRVFKKSGEDGWKAIIPFYNTYTEFKLYWSQKMARNILILMGVTFLACAVAISGAISTFFVGPDVGMIIMFIGAVIALITGISTLVLTIMKDYNRIKCFNMPTGFMALVIIGYLCLPILNVIFVCLNTSNKYLYKGTNINGEVTSAYYKQYYAQQNTMNNPANAPIDTQVQNSVNNQTPIIKGDNHE